MSDLGWWFDYRIYDMDLGGKRFLTDESSNWKKVELVEPLQLWACYEARIAPTEINNLS